MSTIVPSHRKPQENMSPPQVSRIHRSQQCTVLKEWNTPTKSKYGPISTLDSPKLFSEMTMLTGIAKVVHYYLDPLAIYLLVNLDVSQCEFSKL
jgi:hypothetical protein